MSKTFKQTQPSDNNLMIVDGFNLAFRWKHAKKRNFAAEYLQTLASFAHSYSASKVVVLSDGGSNYRQAIFPAYKSQRKEMRANQSAEDAQEFENFMEDWKAAFALASTEYFTMQIAGVEADDIAAYLVKDAEFCSQFDHVWLLSTDKDWDLLVSDNVSRFSYRTRKETTIDNWNEHYAYSPEDHISIKVLQGDKSDSIPGVDGIGEKRAYSLIQQYGSAFDIYASLPLADKRQFVQNLNKFGDQILLNYELMDLLSYCDDALGDNRIKIEQLKNEVYEAAKAADRG